MRRFRRYRDFAALLFRDGRSSVPPEKLLRAMLVQAFYSVRSQRQLMRPRCRRTTGTAGRIRTATGSRHARFPPNPWLPCCRTRACGGWRI